MSFIKHIFNKDSLDEVAIEDIQKLIDSKKEESLHLDYEAIPADVKYEGLAEHISGFLNTSGGIVLFGVSEQKDRFPYTITWSTITKETVENALYDRIDPWNEEIKIVPIENPKNEKQRIFIISVPKSKTPPHMANYSYYIRLNFQTKPIGHDQVSAFFKQSYLQRFDLINSVYGPIYNELISYLDKKKIEEWRIINFYQVRKNKMFLLIQDFEILEMLDNFYERVEKWNKAIITAKHRIVKLTNAVAAKFFKDITPQLFSIQQVYMDIKAETTQQSPTIYEAILNGKDPVKFWKVNYPFDRVSEIKFELKYLNDRNEEKTIKIPEDEFRQFIDYLKVEVEKDELTKHVRNEHDSLEDQIDDLFTELEKRM